MLPNSYTACLVVILLMATSPVLAQSVEMDHSNIAALSDHSTSDGYIFLYTENATATGTGSLSKNWDLRLSEAFSHQLAFEIGFHQIIVVPGARVGGFDLMWPNPRAGVRIGGAPSHDAVPKAPEIVRQIKYSIHRFHRTARENDENDHLERARNDALINGALISLGALGIFDNVVIHWILELHRAVPGPHALAVEIGIVVISTAMLATGIWRERRARRN